MSHAILSEIVAGISELKKSPMATVNSANGNAVAILNRNEPVFYCVPAKMYKAMIDTLEDIHLSKLVHSRKGEKEIAVNIDDL